jgi:hypothetical protein
VSKQCCVCFDRSMQIEPSTQHPAMHILKEHKQIRDLALLQRGFSLSTPIRVQQEGEMCSNTGGRLQYESSTINEGAESKKQWSAMKESKLTDPKAAETRVSQTKKKNAQLTGRHHTDNTTLNEGKECPLQGSVRADTRVRRTSPEATNAHSPAPGLHDRSPTNRMKVTTTEHTAAHSDSKQTCRRAKGFNSQGIQNSEQNLHQTNQHGVLRAHTSGQAPQGGKRCWRSA